MSLRLTLLRVVICKLPPFHKFKGVICFYTCNYTHKFAIMSSVKKSSKGKKMQVIDYAKYSNMTERQLLNSLLNAEKKEAKIKAELQEKLKASGDLISFLKTKLKERIDAPKYNFVDYDKSKSHQIAKEYKDNLTEQEQYELLQEVKSETQREYGDEL